MTRHAIATGYELTVLLSMIATLGVGLRALRRRPHPAVEPPAPSVHPAVGLPAPSARVPARWAHPLTQFAIVCALLLVNQVVFSAYVLRVHGGDASFLARYLGPGWCAIDRGALVRLVASLPGDGHWMSPSVLRVQAFLELPFTLFAYLAVARTMSSAVYRSLTRLPILVLASLSFTSAFSLTEIRLTNPWTTDDVALRALACVVVPLYVAWTARRHAPPREERPLGVIGLLVFLAGAAAIAVVVLVAYDVLLLYNLAHLRDSAFAFAMAWLVAVLSASLIATSAAKSATGRRTSESLLHDDAARSPSLTACRSALHAFTLLFFVPSLAIRYASFHLVAQLSGLLLMAIALVVGIVVGARSEGPGSLRERALAWGIGGAAGVFGAVAVGSALRFEELTLALAALAFLVPVIVVSRAIERMLGGGPAERTPVA